MYQHIPRGEIVDTVDHLNDLHRQIRPSGEREHRAYERREAATRILLSNLPRTKDHPTLKALLEVANVFSLTIEGAHRLFGYNLGSIREFDVRLNGGRTHIVESYGFERDLLVDLPLELASEASFDLSVTLRDLVVGWQTDIPFRALDGEAWHSPGAFYVHVGTEDSRGSSLPPGAIALVEPVDKAEELQPNPRAMYLLQFGNGYRCSRCVVTRGRLHLLTSERTYRMPHDFAYPGVVRVAGRIRSFALRLPSPDYPRLHSLPFSKEAADLILPGEQRTRDRLFATEHKRFRRLHEEERSIREILSAQLQTNLSARTERRYRHPSESQPHVNTLIYLTVMHLTRYTDSLRTSGVAISDSERFSLQTLLNTKRFSDLHDASVKVNVPTPKDIWEDQRRKFIEWPPALSSRFPQLRSLEDRILRLEEGSSLKGLDPAIAPGSWMLLERPTTITDITSGLSEPGWSRPIYVLRRGLETVCGHLERDGDRYRLLSDRHEQGVHLVFRKDELASLNRVAGIAVPV